MNASLLTSWNPCCFINGKTVALLDKCPELPAHFEHEKSGLSRSNCCFVLKRGKLYLIAKQPKAL
jgi:hypothetical protein